MRAMAMAMAMTMAGASVMEISLDAAEFYRLGGILASRWHFGYIAVGITTHTSESAGMVALSSKSW